MTGRPVAALTVIVALAATFTLYAYRLDQVPAYLGLDEFHFAVHAHSLATTGRDLNGTVLPLFINLQDPLGDQSPLPWGATWYHPIGFYLIAAALTALPLSEWAIRIPMVAIGILNIVLMYAAGRQWFGDRRIAIGAAALLAMTPAHLILSRVALDYLLPLPFTLAWLYALGRLIERPGRRRAFISGVILGAGCYSYVSSWLMMPMYLAVTAAVIVMSMRQPALLRPLAAGFALPLAALLLWVVRYPDMPGHLIAQYQAGETRRSVLTAVMTGQDVAGAVRDALGAYWSYFNPSFLFVTGGSSRMVSTGLIGVWPIGTAILLLVGLMQMSAGAMTVRSIVLLGGLLAAPLPAALKGEPFAIQRAIALLPFVVLIAAGSMLWLLERRSLFQKTLVLAALVAVPLQFAGFSRDYFGPYRTRSAGALDATAFSETARELLRGERPPVIALTAPLYDVTAKWRFYATRAGKADWLQHTRYFSGDLSELAVLPSGSVAVVETVSLGAAPPAAGWDVVGTPLSVAGDRPLTILRRE